MSGDGHPLHCVAFCEPKRGNGALELEDAYAANVPLGRFAVADGATESAYAGLWARALVDDFVKTSAADPSVWATWLPGAQTRWESAVGRQPLPWYAEIKWQQGAFATFLGVVLKPPRWQALGVGDSCVFHIRHGRLCRAFPLGHSNDFANVPHLIGSRGFTPETMHARELRCDGEFCDGDRLWLMTDALARWFLQGTESGYRPWDLLEPLLQVPAAEASFRAWIAALRDMGQIRNDDVTLMAVWSS